MLHAAYPNARWEWLADKPSRFAVEGGTARIRVYGIPDFDYADVKLDQKANLDCSLVKLSPLVTGASDTQPPNRQPVNPASGLRHGPRRIGGAGYRSELQRPQQPDRAGKR